MKNERFQPSYPIDYLRFTGLISETSESRKALRVDSAIFRMTIIFNANTTSPQTNTTTRAADPNVWSSKLNKMAYNVKNTENSKDNVLNMSVRTDAPIIAAKWKELDPFNPLKVELLFSMVYFNEFVVFSRSLRDHIILVKEILFLLEQNYPGAENC